MYYTLDGILWSRRYAGPQCIFNKGEVRFSQLDDNSYNRSAGPAVIFRDGTIFYKNETGALHRTDGPAMISSTGSKQYWVNGNKVPPERFFMLHGVM